MSKITVQSESDDFVLSFPDVIDEHTTFPTEKPRLSQRVVFECDNIDLVNSIGMHNWILWMRSLNPMTQYVFRHCHHKVIDMINGVEGFMFAAGVVESFYMPYSCNECDGEEEMLLTRGKEFVEATDSQNSRLLYPKITEIVTRKFSQYSTFVNRTSHPTKTNPKIRIKLDGLIFEKVKAHNRKKRKSVDVVLV